MKKGNKDPNPMVQLSVQDVTRESKVTVKCSILDCVLGCILFIDEHSIEIKMMLFFIPDVLHNH